jgi:predicted SAM-dependent methyltransferase
MIKYFETLHRERCAICSSLELNDISEIRNVPIYMGVTTGCDDLTSDLRFAKCCVCNTIQISGLVPPDILYSKNHNVDIVGAKWNRHFKELSKLISEELDTSDILEVGDPSAKIASICDHDKWTIVEPNPDEAKCYNNVVFIKDIIENVEGGNFSGVVLSHVLEHAVEPLQLLKHIRTLMRSEAKLCISIPNMSEFVVNRQLPPLGMHFEHTFFLDIERLTYMLEASGFKIRTMRQFEEHSMFIIADKSEATDNMTISSDFSTELVKIIDDYRALVNSINYKINNKKHIFLYGAHIMAQMLLSLGLNGDNIECILDNSTSKIGHRLYGTNLHVNSPSILQGIRTPVVICHMGPYTDEIKSQIMQINKEVNFL